VVRDLGEAARIAEFIVSGRLDGKVAIVTGGGSGIGRASALTFLREGARVVIAEVDADRGARGAQEITEQGGEALAVTVDVADQDGVAAMTDAAVEHFGKLDILFCNASGPPAGPFRDHSQNHNHGGDNQRPLQNPFQSHPPYILRRRSGS